MPMYIYVTSPQRSRYFNLLFCENVFYVVLCLEHNLCVVAVPRAVGDRDGVRWWCRPTAEPRRSVHDRHAENHATDRWVSSNNCMFSWTRTSNMQRWSPIFPDLSLCRLWVPLKLNFRDSLTTPVRPTDTRGVAPLGRRSFPCKFYCSCNASCLLHLITFSLQVVTVNFYS